LNLVLEFRPVRPPRRQPEAVREPHRPPASLPGQRPAEERAEELVTRRPAPALVMAREAAHWCSRVELPQHHERARAVAAVPSLRSAFSVSAPAPCSRPSRLGPDGLRRPGLPPPLKLRRTRRCLGERGQTRRHAPPAQPQAMPPAKALLSEPARRKRPAAAQVWTRWPAQPPGRSESGARRENRRRPPTHPTRRRPRR
jgi:hypothetical protein